MVCENFLEETILISIISYREYELQNTVKEFYLKSKYPERLRFAVLSQDETHPDLRFIPDNQIRYLKTHHDEVYGVCWARSIASRMFNDYMYYFQIDGHMFPEQDWDQDIIDKYNFAKKEFGEKVVLTAIPASYSLDTSNNYRTILIPDHGYADVRGKEIGHWGEIHNIPEEIHEVFYLQGACLFSESLLIDEVQIDPEMPYFAEEITYSIRCFTKEYRMIAFKTPILYHLFSDDRKKAGVSNDPWANQSAKINSVDFRPRAIRFFKGELHGKLGVSKKDIDLYCSTTGLLIKDSVI